jgi:hypothetical protein
MECVFFFLLPRFSFKKTKLLPIAVFFLPKCLTINLEERIRRHFIIPKETHLGPNARSPRAAVRGKFPFPG